MGAPDLLERLDAASHSAVPSVLLIREAATEIRRLLRITQVDSDLDAAQRTAQGEFPAGRLNAEDQGALAMAVGVEEGKVVLRFPKPVRWVGMPKTQALELAGLIAKHAITPTS